MYAQSRLGTHSASCWRAAGVARLALFRQLHDGLRELLDARVVEDQPWVDVQAREGAAQLETVLKSGSWVIWKR